MSICYLLDGETPPARKNGKSLPCVRLQAENEELRKELAVNEPLFEALNDSNDGLLVENAKLRELVRNLYACINNRDCDDCEYIDEACNFERNMSELEVDV